ncbi:MAG: hypothetical protein M3N16_00480 [Actinomycetota bacterium]|nr:hypothetical protein [Actinomycetota bacterium]
MGSAPKPDQVERGLVPIRDVAGEALVLTPTRRQGILPIPILQVPDRCRLGTDAATVALLELRQPSIEEDPPALGDTVEARFAMRRRKDLVRRWHRRVEVASDSGATVARYSGGSPFHGGEVELQRGERLAWEVPPWHRGPRLPWLLRGSFRLLDGGVEVFRFEVAIGWQVEVVLSPAAWHRPDLPLLLLLGSYLAILAKLDARRLPLLVAAGLVGPGGDG